MLGEYSFVVVDRRKATVIAGMDSLGIGRIFCLDRGEESWIASDLDFLLEQLPKPPAIDRSSLVDYLGCWGRVPGRTIYSGIGEEDAGHVLLHDGGCTIKRERTWQPDANREIRFTRQDDYA